MFSPSLRGFSMGTSASSHRSKTCLVRLFGHFKLQIAGLVSVSACQPCERLATLEVVIYINDKYI